MQGNEKCAFIISRMNCSLKWDKYEPLSKLKWEQMERMLDRVPTADGETTLKAAWRFLTWSWQRTQILCWITAGSALRLQRGSHLHWPTLCLCVCVNEYVCPHYRGGYDGNKFFWPRKQRDVREASIRAVPSALRVPWFNISERK